MTIIYVRSVDTRTLSNKICKCDSSESTVMMTERLRHMTNKVKPQNNNYHQQISDNSLEFNGRDDGKQVKGNKQSNKKSHVMSNMFSLIHVSHVILFYHDPHEITSNELQCNILCGIIMVMARS